MLKFIGLLLLAAAAAVLLLASTKPDTFRIQRSVTIQALPEKIFPMIDNLKNQGAWSPWEKLDPAMKRTYSGPANGKGAAYAWEGNNQVGQGSMEIIESAPSSKIVTKLDFMKPFEAHNTAEFLLEPQGNMTHVTWAMYGPQPFFAKIMSVIFNCDKMVGEQFDKGLANLKALAEK